MARRNVWLAVLGVPGLFATMGATNCNYFGPVTVPQQDQSAPLVGTRMFFFGDEVISFEPIHHETSDPQAVWVIYPFGYDGGGVRSVEVGHGMSVHCVDAPGVSIHFAGVYDEQVGDVGSSVSNGIYVDGGARKFADYTHFCTDVEEIIYSWQIRAEDFHGNETVVPGGQIIFVP